MPARTCDQPHRKDLPAVPQACLQYVQLAAKYESKVLFAKHNVSTDPETPRSLGVRAMPMFIIYKGGEVSGVVAGTNIDKVEEEVIKAL